MEAFIEFWQVWQRQIVGTLFAFVFGAAFRVLAGRIIYNIKSLDLDSKRIWVIRLRTFLLFLVACTVGLIWFNELQTIALSIAAVSAAMAIATKEFILGFCGTMLKMTSKSFAHGDRIEVHGIRGDVIDQSLLSTTVLEVGPGELTHQYTGRSVVIPNLLFLLEPVKNECFFRRIVLHSFTIPRKVTSDLKRDEDILLEACRMECHQYSKEAQHHMNKTASRKHLHAISVEPRVNLKFVSTEEVDLIVRVAVPLHLRGKVENAILHRFLDGLRNDEKKVTAQSHNI
ncbi:MAG: mechanosensitive ion channel domain-containing protein [Oligoflexales bacterium]